MDIDQTRTITLTRGQLAVLSLVLDAVTTGDKVDLAYHRTSPTVRALGEMMTAEYRAVLSSIGNTATAGMGSN